MLSGLAVIMKIDVRVPAAKVVASLPYSEEP
jgi:hypothetical protein